MNGIDLDAAGRTMEFINNPAPASDQVNIANTNVTQLLTDITDGNSEIKLRRCLTAWAATKMKTVIGSAVKIHGMATYSISIPGTWWVVGDPGN